LWQWGGIFLSLYFLLDLGLGAAVATYHSAVDIMDLLPATLTMGAGFSN